MDSYIDQLMQKMTLDKKIGQLNLLPGYEDIVTGEATASEIGRKVLEGREKTGRIRDYDRGELRGGKISAGKGAL